MSFHLHRQRQHLLISRRVNHLNSLVEFCNSVSSSPHWYLGLAGVRVFPVAGWNRCALHFSNARKKSSILRISGIMRMENSFCVPHCTKGVSFYCTSSNNIAERLPYQRIFTVKTLKFWCLGLSALIAITLTGCEAESVVPLLQSPKDRSIHVAGSGSIAGEPDIATLKLGVSVEKETVAEAREAAAIAMTAVLDSLKANDIGAEDIQTENFSIYPQYDYTDNGRVLRGYRGEQHHQRKSARTAKSQRYN